MAEPQFAGPRAGTFERLQERSNGIRRARPPNITIVKDEAKIPLRTPKPKRESRVGLRNLFSRAKTEKDDKGVEGPSALREAPRSGGIRASLAEISHWSYRMHSARSEGSLLSPTTAVSKSPTTPEKTAQRAATWDPPPLFQVYPQAVKHATLPTCNVPLDVLARLNAARNNTVLQDERTKSSPTLDRIDEHVTEKKGEPGKKRHRIGTLRSPLDWTNKIYVLVTSGYLLQYAAEGAFNRVPEKILQLTKDSAAYASDLIPGRHWVLQVASAADAEGKTYSDPKSLRAKLSLKPNEKKHVSNMLLVFESPEAMDGWLATLRREIQLLGGKKKRSETGFPDPDDNVTKLKTQTSQRTLVVRDPERFSRIISQDFSYSQENALIPPMEDDFAVPGENRTSQSTLDDGSTSASMISSDGQCLDSLRDSGNGGNRLSYQSSGQRTIGSSPACSPTRASFSSHGEDPLNMSSMSEVRLRPNAVAILNRRQSMRNMIPNLEIHVENNARPHSIMSTSSAHEDGQQYVSSPSNVPNFSVPHLASKRLSSSNPSLSLDTAADQPQLLEHSRATRLIRKLPPTARPESRPLSIVVDLPSPNSSRSLNFRSLNSRHRAILEATDAPPSPKPWIGNPPALRLAKRSPKPVLEEVGDATQMSTNKGSTSGRSHGTPELDEFEAPERVPRSASSLSGNFRSFSTTPTLRHPSYKRSSFLAERSFSKASRYSFARKSEWDLPKIREPSLPPSPTCSPKRSVPSLRTFPRSPSSQVSGVDHQSKALMSRRSMPQLAEGPPPAPPPNCALPPIPGKPSTAPEGISI
ncbi:hypothetical protein F5X99DRAFT_289307 [Biscogniauxia marginata]|nr:hypothetical protein F5X99DRAFT_289307 [Biscogniauxia marginata]